MKPGDAIRATSKDGRSQLYGTLLANDIVSHRVAVAGIGNGLVVDGISLSAAFWTVQRTLPSEPGSVIEVEGDRLVLVGEVWQRADGRADKPRDIRLAARKHVVLFDAGAVREQVNKPVEPSC